MIVEETLRIIVFGENQIVMVEDGTFVKKNFKVGLLN
jgi:hypothetical protein